MPLKIRCEHNTFGALLCSLTPSAPCRLGWKHRREISCERSIPDPFPEPDKSCACRDPGPGSAPLEQRLSVALSPHGHSAAARDPFPLRCLRGGARLPLPLLAPPLPLPHFLQRRRRRKLCARFGARFAPLPSRPAPPSRLLPFEMPVSGPGAGRRARGGGAGPGGRGRSRRGRGSAGGKRGCSCGERC